MVEQPEPATHKPQGGADSEQVALPPPSPSVHPLAIVAGATSALLTIAGVNISIRGANGDSCEDRLGATAWHLPMVIAVAAGIAGGWAASRRKEGPK